MSFADNYFVRYKAFPPFFTLPDPQNKPDIIVIIPCYDDEFIFKTLASVERALTGQCKTEVIVHVNFGENAPSDIFVSNKQIFNKLQQQCANRYYINFRLLPILTENIIRKKAGVGYARRIAMDEALRRFDAVGKPDGLIVSLDADTIVSPDYFDVILQAERKNPDAQGFTFQFRHDFDTNIYPAEIINACRLYETYLRYYRLALKTFDSPFAIHTVGSCFAVRADAYAKIGGMPPRQGGEDFYFLQKIIKMQPPVFEVRSCIVYPSPRISNRVPFGTGPSVGKIIEQGDYKVYNFKLFGVLKAFYEQFPTLYSPDAELSVPQEIIDYMGTDALENIISECRSYSSSVRSFVKRMYNHFDAFFIVKFLNNFNDKPSYPLTQVNAAAAELLNYYGLCAKEDDIYDTITELDLRI